MDQPAPSAPSTGPRDHAAESEIEAFIAAQRNPGLAPQRICPTLPDGNRALYHARVGRRHLGAAVEATGMISLSAAAAWPRDMYALRGRLSLPQR